MKLTVDLGKFRAARKRFPALTIADTLKAVNMAGAGLRAELRAATPRVTGATRRALKLAKTRGIDEPMRVGFVRRKGSTGFVAYILEYGRRAAPPRGKKKATTRMAPHPIRARVIPKVRPILDLAFRRVFGERRAGTAARGAIDVTP